jgi:hypothetical protein
MEKEKEKRSGSLSLGDGNNIDDIDNDALVSVAGSSTRKTRGLYLPQSEFIRGKSDTAEKENTCEFEIGEY